MRQSHQVLEWWELLLLLLLLLLWRGSLVLSCLWYQATPSPVNALRCRSLIDASIQPDSLLRVYKPQQGVDIVTSPSPSDVRGRFGSFKPSRAQPIWGPNPEDQNQGGSVPLGDFWFLHQFSRQRALPVFDSSSQLLGLQGAPSPSGGIKDFCGWLRRASLLRLFFTAVFHLHPSEGLCASGFLPPTPPSPNLHGMSPQLFSLYQPWAHSSMTSGEEGREGKEADCKIRYYPSRESNLCQFGVWIRASQLLYRLSYGAWPCGGGAVCQSIN